MKSKNNILNTTTKLIGMYTNATNVNKMEELKFNFFQEDFDFMGVLKTQLDSSHDRAANMHGGIQYSISENRIGRKSRVVYLHVNNGKVNMRTDVTNEL